jgi:hypothetical protein
VHVRASSRPHPVVHASPTLVSSAQSCHHPPSPLHHRQARGTLTSPAVIRPDRALSTTCWEMRIAYSKILSCHYSCLTKLIKVLTLTSSNNFSMRIFHIINLLIFICNINVSFSVTCLNLIKF